MPRTLPTGVGVATAGRKYVAYYRVSTARQGASGLGLDAQKAAVERFLAAAKGALVEEYTEVESGKRHTNRPQLSAAMASAKKGKAILLIAKLDRLARNVAFISNLMESSAEFVACDIPQANRLTIHILAAIAEHEREMISARTVAALEQAKSRGVVLGNPRWQESIGKATEARRRHSESSELDELLRVYKRAGLSLRVIGKRLNDLGVTTPGGAPWYPSSVRSALARVAAMKPASAEASAEATAAIVSQTIPSAEARGAAELLRCL